MDNKEEEKKGTESHDGYDSDTGSQGSRGSQGSNVSSVQSSFILNNPLVVIVGIGKYGNKARGLEDIASVAIDYANIINTFGGKWRYKMFYKDSNANNGNNGYKLSWDRDEILEFLDEIRHYLTKNQHHDGLLFFFSCHGTKGNKLFSSDGKIIALKKIFDQFTDASLIQIPKLFFIDASRGDDFNLLGGGLEQFGIKGTNKNDENKKFLSKTSNFCKLYANSDGYNVMDNARTGSALIRSVCKTFSDINFVTTHNWDDIMTKIRKYTKQFSNFQVVETENTLESPLEFRIGIYNIIDKNDYQIKTQIKKKQRKQKSVESKISQESIDTENV